MKSFRAQASGFMILFGLTLVPARGSGAYSGGPLISEFLASNETGITDPFGQREDWIEIHNPTSTAISLEDWYLTDSAGNLTKWRFPPVALPSLGYMVIFASGRDLRDPGQPLHTNFKLSAAGEYLALVEPDGATVAWEYAPVFPPQLGDVSYGVTPITEDPVTLVAEDAAVTVLVPDGPVPDGWQARDFEPDGSWSTGNSGVGFAGAASPYQDWIAHDIADEMSGTSTSALARFTFVPESAASLDSLELKMRCDDGYVVWLNGVEIARRNAPPQVTWDSVATGSSDGLAVESIDVTAFLYLLVANEANTLAIHALNADASDEDFLILPELEGGAESLSREEYYTVPTPGAANESSTFGVLHEVAFSIDRGYFSAPFSLELAHPDDEAEIRYTLDGSEPTATTGMIYSAPIPISTNATVRAAAYRGGHTTLRPETRTYLFIPDIIEQPKNIDGWPRPSISVADGERVHDYEMDPDIVDDPDYHDDLIAGMTSIPTVSLVVNKSDMWNSSGTGGFYRSTSGLKKPASVEYINPANPAENVQADCSVEGHSHDRMKRSLRLAFTSSYGEKKFDSTMFTGIPFFGDAGNREVDKIVLRAGNNHSFARSWNPKRSTYTEDEWYRSTQIAMGNAGSPGRFVHLFINGIYWGLYNAVQRPDADFAAGSLGGDKEEWFSVSHGGNHGDGSSARFDYLTGSLTSKDMSDPQNYAELQEYVDPASLIDYLLVSWYCGLNDWPRNNWWGGNRNTPAEPFHFFAWDGEWAWGVGNNSNLTAWVHPAFEASRGDDTAPSARIWHAARENPDFLMLVADRLHKHLSEGGALETSRAVERWDKLADLVRDPIVAESARWGDVMQSTPSRRDVEWQDEVDRVRHIMMTGTPDGSGGIDNGQILIEAMRGEGYYPPVDPPVISPGGGEVAVGSGFAMDHPNPDGIVYFTLDGTDPRLPGGQLNPAAIPYTEPLEIDWSLTVNARILDDGIWSAATVASFTTDTGSPLRVTEIMYNPGDPTPREVAAGFSDNELFEFLEIRNVSGRTVDLNGARFTRGLTFVFGELMVPPDGIVLLVKDAAAFGFRYGSGVPIHGIYEGNLDNGGERLRLRNVAGDILFDFTYDDGWYPETDNGGRSLVVADPYGPLAAWDSAGGWQPSASAGGTPGGDDSTMTAFEAWRIAHFDETELEDESISGFDADADQDGFANGMEFVFGTDPRVPQWTPAAASAGVVVSRGHPAVVDGPQAGEWQVVFARRKSADLAGMTVNPQFCAALDDWSDATGEATVIADDGEIEIVALPFPQPAGEVPARFFRLSVELDP